jgi:hypothetical protein
MVLAAMPAQQAAEAKTEEHMSAISRLTQVPFKMFAKKKG